jgi:hypothetical protein
VEFFLSYIHINKDLAGEVGRRYGELGHSAFRAHDDIEPDAEWVKEILSRLESCDALVAIVTVDLQKSTYANQEVGYVLGKGKPAIAFHIDGDLPGFLKWRQAIPTTRETLKDAIEKSLTLMANRQASSTILPPPITPRADTEFENSHEPYRRVSIVPENQSSNLLPIWENKTLITDRENRPSMLADWADARVRQHSIAFETKSRRRGDVSTSGELYYAELFRKQDGAHIGRTIYVVGESLAWAAKVYDKFGVKSRVHVQLKLGNLAGVELTDDPHRILSETYIPDQPDVVVNRTLPRDFAKDLDTQVWSIIDEFARAFHCEIPPNPLRERIKIEMIRRPFLA